MAIKIHSLRARKDNFIYVLNSKTQCVIIDPGEAAPVRKFLTRANLTPTHILCTHHHHDHIEGVMELKQQYNCEVWTSSFDNQRIPGATLGVREDQDLNLLSESLKVLELPGHTLGQIAFWWPSLNAVFVGDTLFSCGCGRLFEGSPEQMFSSMQKLRRLPPETQIYFGHEYTLNNIEFLLHNADKLNANLDGLRTYKAECEAALRANQDTTPTTVARELKLNSFLNAPDLARFTELREKRNHW